MWPNDENNDWKVWNLQDFCESFDNFSKSERKWMSSLTELHGLSIYRTDFQRFPDIICKRSWGSWNCISINISMQPKKNIYATFSQIGMKLFHSFSRRAFWFQSTILLVQGVVCNRWVINCDVQLSV